MQVQDRAITQSLLIVLSTGKEEIFEVPNIRFSFL